jgi:hypothetical protein
VSVTVTGVTSTSLSVAVNYGALPCVQSAATLTASPTATSTAYGSSALFNVSVKNNGSSGCPSDTINLSATVPIGWSKSFGSSSLSLAPGQTAQTTMTVGVPAPYALGTYSVGAVAANTAGTTSTTESVTVTEPVYRLALGLSGSGSVSFSAPVKTCTSSCATDYPQSAPTVVTLTATPGSKSTFGGWGGACSGAALTCTVTMSADRSVSAAFGRSAGGKCVK